MVKLATGFDEAVRLLEMYCRAKGLAPVFSLISEALLALPPRARARIGDAGEVSQLT